MPFFQEAKNFDIRGGSFQDMQEQHNYTDDRSFKITGDGNETHYAPDHSIADNRLYDYRTLTTPGHAPPLPTNPHAYMQSPAFIPSQAGPTQPSAVEQLQGEIQLLQLQLQRNKLRQEIAANAPALRPQNFVNQEPGGPYLLQHQHAQQQYSHMLPHTTAIPQHSTSTTVPDIYSGQTHQSYNPPLQGLVPSQLIPPQNLLAVPPSRPTTVGPPSSIASTSSGEDITPPSLAAQSPTVSQSSAVAVSMLAQTQSMPHGLPSGASQLPPTVVFAPVATLQSDTVPTSGIIHVDQGVGVVQGNVPVVVEGKQKKKKRSLLSKLFRKLGLKKKT